MSREWCLATIRHGETDYNKHRVYAGTIDVELNESGRNDAWAASTQLRSMGFDVLIASPLRRAVETAQILSEGRIEIVLSTYAQERNFGLLQGLTSADVEHFRPPIHFVKAGGDYHSVDPPMAESFEALSARAKKLHRFIMSGFQGRKVLVVSHGTFLQQFHGVLREQDWLEALGGSVNNLELTVFNLAGEKVVSEECTQLTDRKQGRF